MRRRTWSFKEKKKELKQELQQEEEVEIIGTEKVVGELREIDREVDSIISDFLSTLINPLDDLVEPSPVEFEKGVDINFMQPPRYDLRDREELEDIGEEAFEFEEAWQEVGIEESRHVVETPRRGRREWKLLFQGDKPLFYSLYCV